jgi:hypothetical protein
MMLLIPAAARQREEAGPRAYDRALDLALLGPGYSAVAEFRDDRAS